MSRKNRNKSNRNRRPKVKVSRAEKECFNWKSQIAKGNRMLNNANYSHLNQGLESYLFNQNLETLWMQANGSYGRALKEAMTIANPDIDPKELDILESICSSEERSKKVLGVLVSANLKGFAAIRLSAENKAAVYAEAENDRHRHMLDLYYSEMEEICKGLTKEESLLIEDCGIKMLNRDLDSVEAINEAYLCGELFPKEGNLFELDKDLVHRLFYEGAFDTIPLEFPDLHNNLVVIERPPESDTSTSGSQDQFYRDHKFRGQAPSQVYSDDGPHVMLLLKDWLKEIGRCFILNLKDYEVFYPYGENGLDTIVLDSVFVSFLTYYDRSKQFKFSDYQTDLFSNARGNYVQDKDFKFSSAYSADPYEVVCAKICIFWKKRSDGKPLKRWFTIPIVSHLHHRDVSPFDLSLSKDTFGSAIPLSSSLQTCSNAGRAIPNTKESKAIIDSYVKRGILAWDNRVVQGQNGFSVEIDKLGYVVLKPEQFNKELFYREIGTTHSVLEKPHEDISDEDWDHILDLTPYSPTFFTDRSGDPYGTSSYIQGVWNIISNFLLCYSTKVFKAEERKERVSRYEHTPGKKGKQITRTTRRSKVLTFDVDRMATVEKFAASNRKKAERTFQTEVDAFSAYRWTSEANLKPDDDPIDIKEGVNGNILFKVKRQISSYVANAHLPKRPEVAPDPNILFPEKRKTKVRQYRG